MQSKAIRSLRAYIILLVSTLTVALGMSVPASASPVVPLIHSSEVDRVTSVAPLGPSGSSLAVYGQTPGTFDEDGEYEGGRMGLWTLPGDGGPLRLVLYLSGPTRTLDKDTDIVASGDGSWIAWTAGSNSSTVHVVNVATGEKRTLRVRGGNAESLSPVGGDRFYVNGSRGMYVFAASGGEPARVPTVGPTHKGHPQHYALDTTPSANGQHFATCGLDRKLGRSSEDKTISAVLGQLDHETGDMRTRTIARQRGSEGGGHSPRGCAVSDDGSTAVTAHVRRGKDELVVLRDGSISRVRLPVIGTVRSISPNGRYVLVQPEPNERGKARDLLIVNVGSERVRRISNVRLTDDGGSGHVLWTPDSRGLVVESHTTKQSIWSIRPFSGAKVRLRMASQGSWARLLRLSHDGSRVVFGTPVEDSELTTEAVQSVQLDGSGAVRLSNASVRSFGVVASTADGSRAWLVSSWTCSQTPEFSLQRLDPSTFERLAWQQTGRG